ncbi:MAG: sigma-70 family RNA polymerase sigma factor [Clostridia bacterium]|nr:sigma-70 family RNA polymerase sigma factor [Clostridia bacterium]
MINDEIIQYYDYLMRLATAKCNSQIDAEDLVGETMLAAYAYLHQGGIIEYPKTWLANTLYHKYNDSLRKKYRTPITVSCNDFVDILTDEDEEYFTSEEAAKVRKELNHLGFITREVLIRYYFGKQNIADIAEGLDIPEGTVKSRLYAGRNQMKKGLEDMDVIENYLPGELRLTWGGTSGLNHEPVSLVEGDLIAQNLLILAYEKPLTISELSKRIGIPAAYIEPIVKRLVDGELMVQTDSGKIYTDFLITKPQDKLEALKPQLEFARKHFNDIWSIIERMSAKISEMPFVKSMGDDERIKLDRYAVLKALQDFEYFGNGKVEIPKYPMRKDGGRWFAHATAIEAGYNLKEYHESFQYIINGGHRTSEALNVGRAKRVRFYEFDTFLFDSPHRFAGAYDLYFKYVTQLLWCIYDGMPLEDSDIPNEFIAYMPTLEKFGLIEHGEDKPCLKIPVMNRAEYNEMHLAIKRATEEISEIIGEEFMSFISSMKTPVPKHLSSVPELFRYGNATNYFVMGIVREAYDKGLHLKDVDYCCPPALLVYDCEE